MLAKVSFGVSGMKRNKWTTETLHAEAVKYGNRRDFRKGSSKAWHSAVSRGVLDEICNHMTLLVGRRHPIPVTKVLEALDGRGIDLVAYAGTLEGQSKFRCLVDGYEWNTTADSVVRGTGCIRCAGIEQKTYEEVSEEMLAKNICVTRYAGNVRGKSTLMCTVDGCGYTWDATVSSVRSLKGGCKRCSNRENLTKEQVDERLEGRDIKMTRYAGVLVLRKSSFLCTKLMCGHEWSTTAQSVLTGTGCQKCAGTLQLTGEDVVARLTNRNVELLVYGGAIKARSTFRCRECGNAWTTNAGSVLGGSGCPVCAKCGFDTTKEAEFYIYKISSDGRTYVGFGITTDMEGRGRAHAAEFKKRDATGERLFSYKTTGVIAQEYEAIVKKNFPIVDTGIPGFRTEAIEYDDYMLQLIKTGAEHAHAMYLESLTHES